MLDDNGAKIDIICADEDIKECKKNSARVILIQGHEEVEKFLSATAIMCNNPDPIEDFLETIFNLGVEEGKKQSAEKLGKFLRNP